MKFHHILAATSFMLIVGCAHTDPHSDDKSTTGSQEATCVPPPGEDKCVTGGGVTGPILRDDN